MIVQTVHYSLVTISEVLFVENFKADVLKSSAAGVDAPHLGDTVSNLDTVSDVLVVRILRVPDVGHAPFVDTELFGKVSAKGEEREGREGDERVLRA